MSEVGRLHCQGHLETETFAILDSPHVDELVFRALVPGTPGVVVPPGGSPVAAMARAAAQMQALYIIVSISSYFRFTSFSHRFHSQLMFRLDLQAGPAATSVLA